MTDVPIPLKVLMATFPWVEKVLRVAPAGDDR
jgi:hypothetical protein